MSQSSLAGQRTSQLETLHSKLRWDDRGLIPAIVQDATTGEVLTLAYMNIESLRLGERLAVNWDMGDVSMQHAVPPLILQPLLENAIYHGIEPLPAGGTITVTGRENAQGLTITISNPVATGGRASQHKGNQIAQENIRQRLQIAYGSEAGLENRQHEGTHSVVLTIPATGAT